MVEAEIKGSKSGVLSFLTGVGTATMIKSAFFKSFSSEVKNKFDTFFNRSSPTSCVGSIPF